MRAGPHTHQLSLPSNFHASPSHYPYPSPSPTLSSRPFSPALHSSTPLASYTTHRQRYRILVPPGSTRQPAHTTQVSLTTLSPPHVHLGAVGGCFNSTTKVKLLPLPALYTPHQISTRGIRSVRLHTDRYLPSREHTHTTSDSLLNLPSLENRPKCRLVGHEIKLQQSRVFKTCSGVLPHRMEQAFYMSGHSAHVRTKHDFSPSELEEMKAMQYAENPALYYGRGVAPGVSRGVRVRSRAAQTFEVRLKTALEQNRKCEFGSEVELDLGHTPGRDVTPIPTIMEDHRETMDTHTEGPAFVTESRTAGTDT